MQSNVTKEYPVASNILQGIHNKMLISVFINAKYRLIGYIWYALQCPSISDQSDVAPKIFWLPSSLDNDPNPKKRSAPEHHTNKTDHFPHDDTSLPSYEDAVAMGEMTSFHMWFDIIVLLPLYYPCIRKLNNQKLSSMQIDIFTL